MHEPGRIDQQPAAVDEERWNVLRGLEAWLETPMIVLSLLWLILVILELVWGTSGLIETIGVVIWVIFVLEFTLRLTLAPQKLAFVRGNWITVIALVAPAFRLLRAARLFRITGAARSLRLVRIVGTANRTMNALAAGLRRRGLGYVTTMTVFVVLLGAGGMLAFEPASEVAGGFSSYGDALWWTAMLVTTMGTEFWPRTFEGRLLSFLLALYGFAIFGYITASFASYFVGKDAATSAAVLGGNDKIDALRADISALHELCAVRGPTTPGSKIVAPARGDHSGS